MPSKHNPRDCLADILDNIKRIQGYTVGLGRDAFENDGRTRDAVERCLERICEAAFRLGDAAAVLMPNQPWHDIRGMGNWFRHAYDRIEFDTVWDTLHRHLPSLQADAERALKEVETKLPPKTSEHRDLLKNM